MDKTSRAPSGARSLRALVAISTSILLVVACTAPIGGATRIGSPPYVQGSGVQATEHRTFGEFHAVHVDQAVHVVVRSGPTNEAAVTFDDNLLAHVEMTVGDDGVLHVGIDGSVETKLMPRVELTTSGDLDRIEADSAGSIEVGAVDVASLIVRATSAAKVQISGRADRLELAVDTAGSVDLGDLAVRDANVTLSTASRATVRAENSVTGACALASTLELVGQPRTQGVSADTTSSVHSRAPDAAP